MNVSYGITNATRMLMNLNGVKANKDYVYHKRSIDDVDEVVRNIRRLVDQDVKQQRFQITYTFDTSQRAIPEWINNIKEAIKNLFEEDDVQYFEGLSKVFNTRSESIMFFKYKHCYIVFASRASNLANDYYYTLACMLLEYKDDEAFVRRASEAIQNRTTLQFTNEEHVLLDALNVTKRLTLVTESMSKLLQEERPTSRIEEIRSNIRARERAIHEDLLLLRELEMKDFAIQVGLTDNEKATKELIEYMGSISSKILDFNVINNDYFVIVLESILRIPETDIDFFKPEALQRAGHMLYDKPLLARLLKDVMEQKLQVPIRAIYQVHTRNNMSQVHNISGAEDYYSNNATYNPLKFVENAHITRYNCFTGYRNAMLKAASKKDFITMFETMIQCTGSINVFDGTVMAHVIPSILQLDKETVLQLRTDNGWEQITLGGYYEKIKAEHKPDETDNS